MSDYFELPTRIHIKAYIADGVEIVLQQDGPCGEDDNFIVLVPDQIPTLIGWLQALLEALTTAEG